MDEAVVKVVMKRVTGWEKRRSVAVLGGIMISVGVVVLVAFGLAWISGKMMADRGVVDSMDILFEDASIVREFGADVFEVTWLELPKLELGLGIVTLVSGATLFGVTTRQRSKSTKRLKDVVNYKANQYA